MAFLDFLGKSIDSIAKFILRITVAVMVSAVFFQVIWRYFLNNPIIWAEELARYSLTWMTFIGASVALRAGQLASVDLLVAKLPAGWKKIVEILADLIAIVLIGYLFYAGLKIIGLPSVTMQKSPSLRLPMNLVYLCMPLGLGTLLLQSVLKLINNFRGSEVNR